MEKLNSIKNLMKKIALGILLFANVAAFAGGGWTQKKGKAYLKLSEYWIVFDQAFTASGDVADLLNERGIFNTNLYVEYGLTDRFNIITNATIFSHSVVGGSNIGTIQEKDQLSSIGDIDLSAKYRFTNSSSLFAVSGTFLLGLPTGKVNGGRTTFLQTGDGEFNQMIQVDASKSFSLGPKNKSSFISAFLAFNNRTTFADNFGDRISNSFSEEDNFSDEIRFGFEFGVELAAKKLWFISRVVGVESLKNSDVQIEGGSVFANNTEYISPTFELNYYATPKFGISGSVGGAFRGELIAAAPSFNVGVFLDLTK